MAYDYSRAVESVIRSITKYGRDVSFVRLKTGPLNADDPLAGPGLPVAELTVPGISAAFLEPTGTARLGTSSRYVDLWPDVSKIMLVAPNPAYDFSAFDIVIDADGSEWKIVHAETFKPGQVTVLYYIGVSR